MAFQIRLLEMAAPDPADRLVAIVHGQDAVPDAEVFHRDIARQRGDGCPAGQAGQSHARKGEGVTVEQRGLIGEELRGLGRGHRNLDIDALAEQAAIDLEVEDAAAVGAGRVAGRRLIELDGAAVDDELVGGLHPGGVEVHRLDAEDRECWRIVGEGAGARGAGIGDVVAVEQAVDDAEAQGRGVQRHGAVVEHLESKAVERRGVEQAVVDGQVAAVDRPEGRRGADIDAGDRGDRQADAVNDQEAVAKRGDLNGVAVIGVVFVVGKGRVGEQVDREQGHGAQTPLVLQARRSGAGRCGAVCALGVRGPERAPAVSGVPK